MESRDRLQYGVGPSALTVLVAAAVIALILSRLELSDPWAHALGHAVGAAAGLTLLVLALRYWPRPLPQLVSRSARIVLVMGLAVFGFGQGLEGVGAFGFDGTETVSSLAALHDLAVFLGVAGLLLTMLGAFMTIAVTVAGRLNLLETRWVLIATVVAVVAVVLFVIGALIFGY